MTYMGKVQNGVVVFDGPVCLDDGTIVAIEPRPGGAAVPERGTPDVIRRTATRWAGDPAELDELLAEVQRMRDVDLTPRE